MLCLNNYSNNCCEDIYCVTCILRRKLLTKLFIASFFGLVRNPLNENSFLRYLFITFSVIINGIVKTSLVKIRFRELKNDFRTNLANREINLHESFPPPYRQHYLHPTSIFKMKFFSGIYFIPSLDRQM